MDTHDLIDVTAERTGHDPDTVTTIANHLYDITIRALNAGQDVTLHGIGTFTPHPVDGVTFNIDPHTRNLTTGTTPLPHGEPVACCRRPAMTTKEHATT